VPYRIEFTTRAAKDLKAQEKPVLERVAARIDALANDPRPPSSKLLAANERLYRIRVGDYRVIYEIEDRTVLVLFFRVGHRREFLTHTTDRITTTSLISLSDSKGTMFTSSSKRRATTS